MLPAAVLTVLMYTHPLKELGWVSHAPGPNPILPRLGLAESHHPKRGTYDTENQSAK